jgi:hypothetical protein
MSNEFDASVFGGGEKEATQDLGMDALFDVPVDMGEIQEAFEEGLLADGWYTVMPPMTITPRMDATGRPGVHCFARVFRDEKKGSVGFDASWVRADSPKGGPDQRYKNYMALVKTYQKAFEEPPKTVGALLEFFRDNPFQLRVLRTQSEKYGAGNLVVGFKGIDEGEAPF